MRSITRAAVGVLTNNYQGGASTLTQQLIKNTVFNGGMETSSGARIERKIQEQYLALQLTKNVDRKIIITNYLNTINLGNNTLGVTAPPRRSSGIRRVPKRQISFPDTTAKPPILPRVKREGFCLFVCLFERKNCGNQREMRFFPSRNGIFRKKKQNFS